jgi:3-oxoacyl-[acyl-carrier-protein] synthase III
MRIASVKLTLPARTVPNEEVLRLVRHYSSGKAGVDIGRVLSRIAALFTRSGAQNRRWCDDHDTPLDLIGAAVGEALNEASYDARDVELVLYAGMDRGFLEPGNSYFIAQAMGMTRVHCFDILDACNGWVRALHVAHALLAAETYQRVMIINSEFPMFEGGAVFPGAFTIHEMADVARFYAALTLGEGVAVTLVERDPDATWHFGFASRTDLAGLCAVPLPGYERYTPQSMRLVSRTPLRFASNGSRMISEGQHEISKLLVDLPIDITTAAAIFPHAATYRHWLDGASALGIGHLLYNIFPRYGNLGSASVPAAIATAIAEERINRGDTVVCATGGAGMSFAVTSFAY